MVLQTGRVSDAALISTPLSMSCEHRRKIEISIMGELDFFDFQNASSRKCSGHFPRNSTQLNNPTVLQTGAVSAAVLISTPLAMTCEHRRKIEISIM